MPRIALSRASLASLQAEIERRTSKLAEMIARRDALNKQIAELGALAGPQFALAPTPAAKPGRKAKAAAAPKPGKRGVFKVIGSQMILDLLAGGKSLTTAEIRKAWEAEGRGGKADTTLSKLVMAKKLKRAPIKGGQGSDYTLPGVYAMAAAVRAGTKAAQAAMAPVARKPKKRGRFSETAVHFILGLAKGKGATTAQINKAWSQAGRGGSASPNLSVLFKAQKIKREPLQGEKGFLYTVA